MEVVRAPSGLPHCRSMPDPVIRLSICAIDFSFFFFFIFPLPGLVFERRDRELEEAGGDLSMFAGDRGGLRLARSAYPGPISPSNCVCVQAYVCIYSLSLSLCSYSLSLKGSLPPSPFRGAHTAHAPGGASLLPLAPRSLPPACLPSPLPGGISSAAGSPRDLQRFV